ncbi:MAG: DUF2185 domain-containing protein [Chloroflexota bacterium]|nr:DUF2185 domain-containing protein [Chloroflexota bacterium]
MKKKFKLEASEIKRLIPAIGYCYASEMITVEGMRVGYMYREESDRNDDSGWRFFSGEESQQYADHADNFSIYGVNTIANYDPEIIPFLDSPCGTAFGRDPNTGEFIQEDFSPSEH